MKADYWKKEKEPVFRAGDKVICIDDTGFMELVTKTKEFLNVPEKGKVYCVLNDAFKKHGLELVGIIPIQKPDGRWAWFNKERFEKVETLRHRREVYERERGELRLKFK